MRPFIQSARLLFPLRLYFPFSGLQVPQVLEDEDAAPCSQANWTIRALTRWATCSVQVADLAPEVGIVLFVLCDDASL